MADPKPHIPNKQEIIEGFSAALKDTLLKASWTGYYEEDIPMIAKALGEAGFNLIDFKSKLELYSKNSPLYTKTMRENKDPATKVLDNFIMEMLYPIATIYYLEKNKEGMLEEENLNTGNNRDERWAKEIPLGVREGVQGNLLVDLYYKYEENSSIFSEEVKNRLDTFFEKSKKKSRADFEGVQDTRSKEEKLKDEKESLEEKLFFEKLYFELLFKNKIGNTSE